MNCTYFARRQPVFPAFLNFYSYILPTNLLRTGHNWSTPAMEKAAPEKKRGALIVFEGCDRCGKSTQSKMLADYLQSQNINVKHMGFPARQSNIGKVINSYLTNQQELSDECIHLLFSANRWEFQPQMKQLLLEGTTLVLDRYSYSGVAYSVSKGLNYDWCMMPERGLIEPDVVFMLKTNVKNLLDRGNFGEERYEKADFQDKVAQAYKLICARESKHVCEIDANQSIEHIHGQIVAETHKILELAHKKELRVF